MSDTTGPFIRSRKVIAEMLEQRGYDTSGIQLEVSGLDEETSKIILKKNDGAEIQVHYDIHKKTQHKKLFNTEDKSGKVNDIIEKRKKENKNKKSKKDTDNDDLTIIFVIRDKPTPTIVSAVQNAMKEYKIFIQIFNIRSLMYNITHHQIVPKHERVYGEELNKLLHGYNDKEGLLSMLHISHEKNLPIILASDPVAMFIGLRPHEICKITRPSQSAGKHIVYRYCINE
tara:strand:- start:10236 stop:10922 length:687 start_codon:yes stop_codon:yes gene_type:complete